MPNRPLLTYLPLAALALLTSCTRDYNQQFIEFHESNTRTLFPRSQVNDYLLKHEDEIKAGLRVGIKDTYLRKANSADIALNILTLSGGGEWGAYGSGFLAGWSASGTRPEFDIVTGVSTGSLIATFAFLGTKADDDALKAGYLGIQDSDIYQLKYELAIPLVLLYSNSITRTDRLRSLVKSLITPDVVKRVAAEHAKGRRLYVGSVNTDLGRFIASDLTAIAKSGNYDRYIDSIMASAAIPVFFQPIYIDGFQHVDGGVMRNVFMENLFADESLLCNSEFCLNKLPLNLYTLINGTVEARGYFIKDRFLSIGVRGLELLQNERMLGNVFRISQMVGTNHALEHAVYRIHSIPPGTGEPDDETQAIPGLKEHDFDPAFMKVLYDAGVIAGKRAASPNKDNPWFTNINEWERSLTHRPSQPEPERTPEQIKH